MERQQQVFAAMQAQIEAPRPRRDLPDVTSYYDLPYAVVPGFRPLSLDLHIPDGDGPFPCLLWVHGGGWRVGTRTMGHAQRLTRHGFAIAAVQYRLSGEARFPAQLHDLKGAVRWLRANAAGYRLDPHRLAAWGASAGAHLVSLLGLTDGNADFEGDVGGNLSQSSAVQAIVAFFGVMDFFSLEQRASVLPGPSTLAQLLGYEAAERPDAARAAMPITYVRADAPPILFMHGDVDPLVPHAQSQRMHDALRQAGADATLVTLPGAYHEDQAFWSDETLGTIRAFLERSLNASNRAPVATTSVRAG
jgi:acetyl esterase/lipase